MLARLLAGAASRQELINFVRGQVEDAYAQSPEDSFCRDLRLLRYLGFQVSWQRSHRAYCLQSFDHPVLKIHLAVDALEGLALVKHAFKDLPHSQRFAALASAIEARLPDRARRALRHQPLPAYSLAPADQWPAQSQSLQIVEGAIRGNQRLEFLYRSPKRPEREDPKRHIVEPYQLEYREGHLYFEGYDLKTGRVYLYRVDRIVPGSAKILPDVFMPRERLHHRIRIRYWLAAEIARYGASRRFLAQHEEQQDDGSVIVTAEVYDLFEALKTLLKYGSGCRALEPPELVNAVREEAMKMVEIYEGAAS